jgi:hypothetical protein
VACQFAATRRGGEKVPRGWKKEDNLKWEPKSDKAGREISFSGSAGENDTFLCRIKLLHTKEERTNFIVRLKPRVLAQVEQYLQKKRFIFRTKHKILLKTCI